MIWSYYHERTWVELPRQNYGPDQTRLVSELWSEGFLWVTHQQKLPATRPTHHLTREITWGKQYLPGIRVKKYFQHRLLGNWLDWLLRGGDKETLAGTVGWGGWEESPSPQNAFCFMATCPHLRGKIDREAVFLLAWNKGPMGISRCIWSFGCNQWPRNQNSLVLISSRAVKIIGRVGLH